MSVCLIVAFYHGDRDSCKYKDTLQYKQIQKKALRKYKNSLSKIIFTHSVDTPTTYIDNSNPEITYFYRENKDLSFGA